jgi:hypothetical protein
MVIRSSDVDLDDPDWTAQLEQAKAHLGKAREFLPRTLSVSS